MRRNTTPPVVAVSELRSAGPATSAVDDLGAALDAAADCDPVRVPSHQPNPGTPRFARGTTEFDRALAFFDGTYAVALTLLVTTLNSADTPDAWADPAALWAAFGTEIISYFVAFTVVAAYWRANHTFVARLHHLSARFITVNLVLLAFLVLLPFTTDTLGRYERPLATAVFAGDVAVIGLTEVVMFLVAWRNNLMSAPPSPGGMRLQLLFRLVNPAVFLASIPVAYLASPAAARLSWLTLAVLNPLIGVLADRRAPQA
jgi:uncharacterized membrane protein